MLACIEDAARGALVAATVALGAALVVQERRAADPIVPLRLLRTRTVAVVSIALFLATASLFAITVFVPLFLQTTTGATPTEAGLLLVPAMLGITVSTNISGRLISRTGRYKRFPILGLALMTTALAGLAALSGEPSRTATAAGLVVFGLGFGMVAQVLTLAIQNTVDRRDIGIATGSANLFRSLGGSVGVAVFGALFAARLDTASIDPERLQASPEAIASMPAAVQDAIASAVAHALDTVFLVAAPVAALGLLVVLFLKEVPLRGPGGPKPGPREAPARPDQATEVAA
jgi:MFS family permease